MVKKSLLSALPIDICCSLVFKEPNAKTQSHKNGCPHTGKKGLFSCGCPCRLAYSSTVDSYIGKLRSIFAGDGREEDWYCTLLQLTTCASHFQAGCSVFFFPISFCCSLTTSREGLLCLPLMPQNSLLPLAIRSFSRPYSTLVTGRGILAR